MSDEIPWQNHAIRGAGLLFFILLFQTVFRGEISLGIALFAAIGYVVVAEFIRRWTN